jgi:transposase
MLDASSRQPSFFDTDQICKPLFPPDSFWHRFRELIYPLINDEDYACMYCPDRGRPAKSPALLTMVTILQRREDLSDREAEERVRYDLRWKYALGLEVNDEGFDHSLLGKFRDRLLSHGKERMSFEKLLEKLVEEQVLKPEEVQITDATQMVADISIPNTLGVLWKANRSLLISLKARDWQVPGVEVSAYRGEVRYDRLSEAERRGKLVELVEDSRRLVAFVEDKGKKLPRSVRKKVEVLQRILGQRVEEDEEGEVVERSGRVPSRIVSPVDPEARWGRTGWRDARPGYKANLMMAADSQFVTNIRTIPAQAGEEEDTVEMVAEQHPLGLRPGRLLADAKYGSIKNRVGLKEVGVGLVAPLKRRNRRYGNFGADEFTYLEGEGCLRCPGGKTARLSARKKRGLLFRFAEEDCGACGLKERCIGGPQMSRFRSVSLPYEHLELAQVREYMKTESFTEEMKRRRRIEAKIAELVRWHGMRRARYRGLGKVNLQCLFTALAVNIKRWFNLNQARAPALALA